MLKGLFKDCPSRLSKRCSNLCPNQKTTSPTKSRSHQKKLNQPIRTIIQELLRQTYQDRVNLGLSPTNCSIELVELGLAGLYQNSIDGYVEHALRIVHHLSPLTWTGYYSLYFNRIFVQNPIRSITMTPSECFPEVYTNPELTSDELNLIQQRIDDESQALIKAFGQLVRGIRLNYFEPTQRLFRSIDQIDLPDQDCPDLYTQNRICPERIWSSPPLFQIIIDDTSSGPQPCCLDLISVLTGIHQGQINPLTHWPIHPQSLTLIQSKYPIELKLVKASLVLS